MKSLERCRPSRRELRAVSWFDDDDDDEPTAELSTLRSLTTVPVAIVREAAALDDMRRMFVELRVPAIAVVDAGGALRGIVTRTDVLRALDARSTLTAEDAMSGYVFALPADAPIERAAALMAFEGVGQVVVTDEAGGVVGMVSALDIARHYAIHTGYLSGSSTLD